ncbi:MAG: twin-arginine translocase TatA/TatE family subunit [Chloroflexota bacterium]
MPSLGLPELIIILVLALIIFGPGKLPDVGRALGRAMAEFRRAAQSPRELPPDASDEPQRGES